MNLRSIAHALGGELSNGQVLCPGPGHSRRDRSLSVKLSPTSPDGFVCFSHAGDGWQDCREHIRRRLGIVPAPGQKNIAPPRGFKPAATPSTENRTRDLAREIFFEAIEPRRTLGEHYLRVERLLGDILDHTLAQTLRFHADCPFKDGDVLVRSPAIVAALRDPRTAMGACSHLGEMDAIERRFLSDPANVLAIQRIRLDANGRKVERRSLGPLGNSVVFVSSIWESFYSGWATIGEGVETMLAMRKLGFTGCVALATSSRFKSFVPPFHWGEIVIAGENDAGASQGAWRGAGPRWATDGHNVRVWVPPAGHKDANDLVIAKAREARAE